MRRSLRRPHSVIAILAALPLLASAGSSLADEATEARAAYAAGTASLQRNAYREAAEQFETAARLRPHSAAFFAAAKAWQQAGDTPRAADGFAAAIELGALSETDRADATKRLTSLRERLGWVQLTGDRAMEAQIDEGIPGKPVCARHAFPGKHVLSIRGPEGTIKKEITLAPGNELPVDLLQGMIPPRALALPSKPAAPPPPPPRERPSSNKTLRALGIVGLATGGVGAGVTVALGVSALGARDTFRASTTQAHFDRAKALEAGTNVAWIASAVFGAAGGALLIVSFVNSAQSSTARAGAPSGSSAWLSLSPAGASVSVRF